MKSGNRKASTNWKRIISRLLVLVMIMTTAPIAEVAQAAEVNPVNVVENTEENLTEDTDVESEDSTETDETANTEENSDTEESDSIETTTEVSDEETDTTEDSNEGEESQITETVVEEVVEDTEKDVIIADSDDKTTTVVSPEVNGYKVTFRYVNDAISEAHVLGTGITSSGWTPAEDNKMEKVDGVFVFTTTLSYGSYEYKFYSTEISENSGYVNDPNNNNYADGNDNNIVRVGSPEVNGNSVTFRYKDDTGKTVQLAGTMTSWQTNPITMTDNDDGLYTVTVELEDGTHEYKFIVNGTWMADPMNPSTDNSVVTVGETVEVVSPEIDGKNVTFRYYGPSATNVNVVGIYEDWAVTETNGMTKDNETGIFSKTIENMSPGYYTYKFIVDSKWLNDPANSNKSGDNNYFVVAGLADKSKTAKKGSEIDLSDGLDFTDEEGTTKTVIPTFTLKTTEAEEYVTIDGTTVIVDAAYEGSIIELTATAEGYTSTVTISLVEKEYTYTIYAYSHIADRVDINESELHIWDEAGESVAEAADYAFTETETIDGKTWLKREVTLPYAQKLGLIFRQKEEDKDDATQWACSKVFFENSEEAETTTLYLVDGQSTVFTDIKDVEYTKERYFIIEYTREDGEYENANVYAWNTDYGTVHYMFESVNGKYIVKFPVLPSTTDKTINFIVKKDILWGENDCNKDGGDNSFLMPADQDIVKIKFANGKITESIPYNIGTSVDRENNSITFYYRDDELFLNNNLTSLKDKIKLVVKSSTGSANIDGSFDMQYDDANERFYYNVPLEDSTDYYYYYLIDGTQEVLDAFNNRTITVEEKEYSLFRNMKYNVNLTASVENAEMDYNDNNIVYIDWAAPEGGNIDGFNAEKIYADLSQLGLGSKVAINTELKALTIACKEHVTPGVKTIKVTVLDDCENKYTTTTTVTVKERVKTANTEEKLGDFDWDEAVIYFAITDRFSNGNKEDDGSTEGFDADDTTDDGRYHGGDFVGLTNKLDYLYDLGVNTIWLTPIVDNVDGDFVGEEKKEKDPNAEYYGYHGYWAEDFTTLNPHLGTEAEFESLINEAHVRGMKIMVDVVLNHAGYGSEDTFNKIIFDGNGGYIDMIRSEENTVPNDEIKDSTGGLPDFVTENPAVREQIVKWQTDWVTKYDIDYYRVDTVKHVENTTWEAFKNSLTKINPDFKLIGEYYGASYGNTHGQLDSGKMDSLLDFQFKYYAEDFVGGDISSVEAKLADRNNGIDNTATLGGFLSSHDEDGLLYKLNNNTDDPTWAEGQMKVAATLQITAKGQPVIYYGEEIGQTGANDWPYYSNRYDFDWAEMSEQEADTSSLYNHYKTLLNIRRDYSEVFAKGTRNIVVSSDAEGYEVIRRGYEDKNVYVGMNIWGDAKETTFAVAAAAGSVYTDLYNKDESGNNKTYTVAEDGTLTITIPGARDGGTVILVTEASEVIEDTNTVTLKLHYTRNDATYTDWNAWLWTDTISGKQYDFVEENGEMVATMQVPGRSTNTINYIIRKGEWKEKDVDTDQTIDISDVVSGTVHFYVNSGVAGGTRVLGADAILGSKVVSAKYDRANNQAVIVLSKPVTGDMNTAFVIKRSDETNINITSVETTEVDKYYGYLLALEQDLTPMSEVVKSYKITYDGYEYTLAMPNIYSSEEFENEFTYTGNDLGATWSAESTTFKVWAPTADKVQLALYASGTAGTEDRLNTIDMVKGEKGVWSAVVKGDIKGQYYTYLVSVDGKVNEACDPYATTTGVNGNRAMVIDLASTNPEGWAEDVGPHKDMTYTDAVIYELHVRDASIDESSGVSDTNKGKFLGLTETGTTTAKGVPTALDHIVDMGVTHVHLLPVYDYGSVDETKLDTPQFNWGYDPVNFNVPEGSYSTDPYNGETRVKEMKQMVKTLHDNNINVIMDVVYNHVYDADSFGFNQIVPKYFSRTKEDGSYNGDTGCGNTTASERAMVHKYIVDSVLYWHNEYHIDGFRFDLVGLIDTETMNAVINAVHAVDPDIIFYGEGWNMSTGITKDGYSMATQGNAYLTSGLAYFSDTIRNGLGGNNELDGQGYIFGVSGMEELMRDCFKAMTSWCPNPTQTVNYASCHDNYTLMDKINGVATEASETDRIKMNNLAAVVYMTSQGIPFIHAGEEFLRTKIAEDGEVIHNSYNSSDYVNKLRWSNLEDEKYADVVEYYKGLIAFRKNHEALRLTTKAEVQSNVTYHWVDNNVIMFDIKGKSAVPGEVSDGIVVIFNPNASSKTFSLSTYGITGEWKVCIDAENAGTDVLRTITDGNVTVDAISALVLVQGETVDTDSIYIKNHKETISLDKTNVNLKIGNSVTLTATSNMVQSDITWKSSNAAVATVDAAGKVTAVATGSTTITATTPNGTTATCTVNVYEYDFTISKEAITLDLTKEETATLTLSNGTENAVKAVWTSSNESIATVDAAGVVTPVGVGKTTISAAIENGPVLTCEVTVVASLKSMAINPASLELGVGETQTLNVRVTPVGATADVTWTSSDSAVVTVDATGKVTGVATGTATITAKAGEITATCTVTVVKKLSDSEIVIPTGITAITNIHTVLDDVTLPEGWAWTYGDTPLKSFAGFNIKTFPATYTKEDYVPVTRDIPVKIDTISNVSIGEDASVVEIGKTTVFYVSPNGYYSLDDRINLTPLDMISVKWESANEEIATVTQSAVRKTEADVKGIKAGKTQIIATVTVSDGKLSKTIATVKNDITVTEEALSSINFKEIQNFTKENDSKFVHSFVEGTKAIVTIESTATALTLKSNDNKVLTVGKAVKGEDGKFTAELTIKKPGYVELSAIAKDAAKTTKAVALYIKDAVPNVSTDKVELNNKCASTATISVYPNEAYQVESVSIDGENFVLAKAGENDYTISLKPGVEKGKYTQILKIKIKGVEQEFTSNVAINVISKEPTIKVKQTAKVNLFYTDADANGILSVTGSAPIEKVELKETSFTYHHATKEISVNADADRTNLDVDGIVSVTFVGYTTPIEKNIKIATENKAPKLIVNAKSGDLYPKFGIETAQVNITDTTKGRDIAAADIKEVTFKQDKGTTAYKVVPAKNSVRFTRTDETFTTKATANIAVQRPNYSEAVTVSYAINVNTKDPKLVLSKKAVTLNKAIGSYESDVVQVNIKNAPVVKVTNLTVEGADTKATAELGKSIILTAANGTVTAGLRDVTDLTKGNYKFNISAKFGEADPITTKVTVKVVDVEPEKTVKLKASGSIDVLNRDTTAITYTTTLKNINGKVDSVALSGRSAHLFKAELIDGKVVLTAKDNANLVTKYNYGVKMRISLVNSDMVCHIVTDEFKVKLTQSKPKVTASPKQAVMFNTVANSSVPVTLTAQNKDGSKVQIKAVQLTNFTNAFAYKDGKLTLVNREKVVKGKTYTLKFNVYCEGCADSEKPIVVTYKVKMN